MTVRSLTFHPRRCRSSAAWLLLALPLLVLLCGGVRGVSADDTCPDIGSCSYCAPSKLGCDWCLSSKSCVVAGDECPGGGGRVTDSDENSAFDGCNYKDSDTMVLNAIVIGSILGGLAVGGGFIWLCCLSNRCNPMWLKCRGGREGMFCCPKYSREEEAQREANERDRAEWRERGLRIKAQQEADMLAQRGQSHQQSAALPGAVDEQVPPAAPTRLELEMAGVMAAAEAKEKENDAASAPTVIDVLPAAPSAATAVRPPSPSVLRREQDEEQELEQQEEADERRERTVDL